jgi:hypothetical protein
MPVTVFRHDGDWDEHTRSNKFLNYIETYVLEVGLDTTLPYPNTKWYSPHAVFRDTTNVTYTGADAIKTWMLQLFSPFDKVTLQGLSFQVVDESDGPVVKATVNAEFQVAYYLHGDPEPVFAPRLFVFTIENAEGEGDEAYEGLQFTKILLYWDPALVKNEVVRRAAAKQGVKQS